MSVSPKDYSELLAKYQELTKNLSDIQQETEKLKLPKKQFSWLAESGFLDEWRDCDGCEIGFVHSEYGYSCKCDQIYLCTDCEPKFFDDNSPPEIKKKMLEKGWTLDDDGIVCPDCPNFV